MTDIGEIPNDWKVRKLGEIVVGKGEYGIGASATEYIEGKPRYLRITDIGDSCRLLFNDIKGLDDDEYDKYILKEGDIVFARTGNTTGKAYVYNKEHGELVYAGFLIKYSIDNNMAKHNFIKYVIQSKRYWDWVNIMSTRSGQPGINSNEYSSFIVQLPTIKEQEKIASILSTVDEQIDNVDELIQKNKELKKGLMQQLLTKGIGHTKFNKTEIGDIPEEWEVVSLSEITDVRDGTHDSPKYLEAGIPFITSKNLKENKIDFSDVNFISEEDHIRFSQRSNVENGDILFGMIGTIGNPVIVNKEFEFSIKNVALIKFNKSSINNKYILNLLKSTIIENQFLKLSNGGVQKFIALSMIRELKIPVPKVEEQERIASILSELDKKIEEYENKKQKLEELKKGLMQELLTGKIRVI